MNILIYRLHSPQICMISTVQYLLSALGGSLINVWQRVERKRFENQCAQHPNERLTGYIKYYKPDSIMT